MPLIHIFLIDPRDQHTGHVFKSNGYWSTSNNGFYTSHIVMNSAADWHKIHGVDQIAYVVATWDPRFYEEYAHLFEKRTRVGQ